MRHLSASPVRRALAVLLVLLLSFTLAACGRRSTPAPTATPPPPTQTPAPPTAAPATNTPVPPTATAQPTAASTATVEPTVAATAEPTPEARIFFQQPTNNARVPLTFTVVSGVQGLTVEPSGEVREGAGHLHLLINSEFIEAGQVIPKDERHIHLGDGATEMEISLPAGSHTLRLQFADGAHVALEGEQYRDEIVIAVVAGAAEQGVRFASPGDGATVPPTFAVVMAASGLTVEPAGAVNEGAGHLHILVDTDFVPAGQVITKDEQHLHFGTGALETELTLTPGEHVLRLQFADGAHVALEGEQYRDEITVTVEEDAPPQKVMFVLPQDGATVTETVKVKMAAAGLIVEPAGLVIRSGAGHLHILIDTDFVPAGEVIPRDEQHLHYGNGATEAEITLTPGEHVLRLQMANGAHIAIEGDIFRDEITVTVE